MRITNSIEQHFVEFEGLANHFYLDGNAIVTVGIGCVVTLIEALSLPFLNKETLVNATTDDIKEDFREVSLMEKNHPLSYYEKVCKTYLPERVVYELFERKLQKFIDMLPHIFPELETYSEGLQLVLLDMAFNLGISGLAFKFPKFCIAVKEGNFEAAATESIRIGVSQKRNEWAFETLMGLVVKA